ncbi:MAG: hypothetical protein KC656_03040, partial [Myxococcales bacterium]|nr:hypothetical protein [Myxococcales bacterium]
ATDPTQTPPTARPGTTKSGPGVQEPSPEPRVTGEEREEPVHVEPERDAPQHHEPRDDESEAPEPTRRTRSLTTFVPRKSDPSRPRSLTTHLDTSPFAREHTPTERDEDPRVSLFTASRLLSVVNGPTSTATFLEAPEETPETPGGPRTTALERAGRTKRERSGAVTRRDGHRNREEIDETEEVEEVDETGEDTPKRRERGPGLVQRVRKGLRALSLGRAMRRKAAGMQERIRERGAERRRQEVAQRVERELTEQTRQREEQAERTRTLQRLQDDHDRRRKKKAPVDETTGDVETPEHPKDTRKPEVEEPGRPTPTTSEASPKEPEPREDRDEAPEDAPEAGRKPGKRPLDPEIGKLVDRMMELVAPTSLNQEARQLLVRGAMATLKASSSGEMVTLDGETDEDDTEKPTGRASEKVARSRQTLRDDHAKLIKDRPLSQKKKELADVELLLKTEEGRQLVEDELRARKKEPELPLTKEEERDRKREIRRIQRVQKALGLTDTQLDEVEDLTPMAKGVRLQREMARGYVPKGAAPKGHDRGLAAESLLRAHPELRTITGSDGAPVFLEAPETDDTTTDTEAPTAKKGGYVPKGRAPEGYDREAVRSRLRASSRLSATPEVREDVSTDEDAPKTRKRANALVGGEGVRKVTSPTEQVGLSAPEDTGTEAPRPRSTGRRNPMARGPRQATALNRPIRWVEKQLGRPGAWGRSKVDALTAWTVGEKKVLNRRPGGVVPVTGQGEQTHLSVPETAPTGEVPHSTVRQRAEADQKQRDAESEGLRERRDREKDQKEQRKAKKFGWTAPKELIRRHQRALQEKVEERSAEREGRTAKHHRKPGAGALKARRAPIELADEEQLLKALRALVDRSPEAMDLLDRVHQELVELDHLEGLRRR